MKIIAESIRCHTGKGTPHYWIFAYDMEQPNPGVFAVRAWGKNPNNAKSMALKSKTQCSAYYEKWKQEKTLESREEIGKFDTIEAMTKEVEQWFPWLNLNEHANNLADVFGVSLVPTHTPVVSKPQIPVQQLPETYGWW